MDEKTVEQPPVPTEENNTDIAAPGLEETATESDAQLWGLLNIC